MSQGCTDVLFYTSIQISGVVTTLPPICWEIWAIFQLHLDFEEPKCFYMTDDLPGRFAVHRWCNRSVTFRNVPSRTEPSDWAAQSLIGRFTSIKSSSSSRWAGQTRPSRPPPSAWRTWCSERSPGPRPSRTTWCPGPPGGCTWCVQNDQSFWPVSGKSGTDRTRQRTTNVLINLKSQNEDDNVILAFHVQNLHLFKEKL